MSGPLFAGYPATTADEAVSPDGRLRDDYARLAPGLERLGIEGLAAAAGTMAAEREARGIAVGSWSDGRQTVRPFPLDPVPRIVPAREWARVAAGVEQRHRALNAFLADAYRAAGRRRGDADRAPELVRAGVLPEWAVAHSPARHPDAVGLAWRGQPRATVAGTDVVRDSAGGWTVLEDHLDVPAGLGCALANRRSARVAVRGLFRAVDGPVDTWTAVPRLRAALDGVAPPECAGVPSPAVLTTDEGALVPFEPRLLAEALGVPLVRPAQLWPRADGGIEASVGGRRVGIDVVYRWFDDGELRVHRTPAGLSLGALMAEGVRAGRLSLVNVPGNAVADDRATFAWVPAMIRVDLGEQSLLAAPRTWVLADAAQWAEVRERLHQLVLKPVGGYGGGGSVVGPACSAAELAQLQAEVAAAPHRFVAQEPAELSTVPTFADGALEPRPVELRVFSVADPGGGAQALPAPLTRLAGAWPSPTKDTWLLP